MSYTTCKFYDQEGKPIGDALVSDEVDVVQAGDKVYLRGDLYDPELKNQFGEVEAPQVSMIFGA
jgi:hypothetical protein